MQKLCDLSFARPGGAAIKATGYSGVIRYLSRDTSKTLGAVERDDYLANGLSIRLVFEDTAQGALGGNAQGVSDGQVALAQAKALGFPQGFGVYFAVDFDATPAQQAAIDAYGEGFRQGLGGYYDSAIYGGYYPVSRAVTDGSSKKTWQTCAWSGGQVISGVNIYQTGQSDMGGAVDVDELYNDDGWGWTNGSTPSSTPVSAPATPAPAEAQSGQTLELPASAPTWHIYNANGPYTLAHALPETLKPSEFGGLTYTIEKWLAPSVAEIKTADFGNVGIYVSPSTGAIISSTPEATHQPVQAPAQGGQTLYLPASAPTWHIYKVGGPYTLPYALPSTLEPAKFGGLTYPINRWITPGSIAVITTADFGQVAIYVAPSTGAEIK